MGRATAKAATSDMPTTYCIVDNKRLRQRSIATSGDRNS